MAVRQVISNIMRASYAYQPLTSRERLEVVRASSEMGIRNGAYAAPDDRPTLIDYIAWCHVQNFQFTWLCVGEFGSGKSTLLAWLLYYFYGWGKPPEEGWREAMKYTVYNIEDVDVLRELAEKRGRLPLIVVDDASLQLHSREFNSPMQRMFMRSYQTIREYANTVIFALNVPKEIDVSIREKVNGLIYVLSPLDMLKYMNYDSYRRIAKRCGSQFRVAWFCIFSRRPDYSDPIQTYKYYTPIHGPDWPFIFFPLPKTVEKALREKKLAATKRVDYMRSVMLVRNPKNFRILNQTLSSMDKRILRALCHLYAESGEAVKTKTLLESTGLTANELRHYLMSLYSVSPSLVIQIDEDTWRPTMAGIEFSQQLEEIESGLARAVQEEEEVEEEA